jgi:hypothetical protein
VKGYVTRKVNRWYAVIYEGLDPVTGKERRRWHPAGTSRDDAERLAASLAAKLNGRNDNGRSLTFGVYLTTRWLPGKKLELAHSTWDGYRRQVELHLIPSLGRIPIRRLRPHHLESCTARSSTREMGSARWPRKPCWRSISSSVVFSTTPSAVES